MTQPGSQPASLVGHPVTTAVHESNALGAELETIYVTNHAPTSWSTQNQYQRSKEPTMNTNTEPPFGHYFWGKPICYLVPCWLYLTSSILERPVICSQKNRSILSWFPFPPHKVQPAGLFVLWSDGLTARGCHIILHQNRWPSWQQRRYLLTWSTHYQMCYNLVRRFS